MQHLKFIVPPACQGQLVTYAYAVDPGRAVTSRACIVRRRTCGTDPTLYELFEDPEWESESSDNLEFHNREPHLGALVESWTE